MWKRLPWRTATNATAIRNARHASNALAQQRKEREEVEAFLAASVRRIEQPLGA